jgi:protease-4
MIAGIAVLAAMASAGANAQYFQKDAKVVEQYHSLSKTAVAKVAVVDISGAIMGGGGFIRSQIDRIIADEDVKAVVLRIDSPGGTVSGSDEIHYRIQEMMKGRQVPVVVSMGGIAASGGYYIAMAAGGHDDVIYAEPATITGSIGVIIPHFDVSKLLKRLDIEDESITSGPLKGMLSPTKQVSPELAQRERKILQALVDEMFGRFKTIVKQGRPKLDDAKLAAVSTGQIFTAQQAIDAGLVDRIGFVEDAIGRAVELAGLTKETARVVKYVKPKGLVDELIGGGVNASVRCATPWEAFAEWTTPRAWYLCSWWPALVTNE